jgi:hypothetical protein
MPIFVFGDYSQRSGGDSFARTSRSSRKTQSMGGAKRSRSVPESPIGYQDTAIENDLTPRQLDVFRQMLAFQEENGRPPTQLELSRALGLKSEQGVKAHLTILEAKGYVVSMQKGAHRNKVAVWPDR